MKKIVGIDPGSVNSGIVVLENGKIRQGYNVPNVEVVDFINKEYLLSTELHLIIEDVRPYSMRITDGIIQTIKFLGWIEGKLSELGRAFELIPRHQVKQWVFVQFKTIAVPEIEKKIIRAGKRAEKKWQEAYDAAIKKELPEPPPFKPRNSVPTFVYVDDRIVANAMRKWWNIKKPSRPGQRAAYGLKDHSFQALGLVSFFMAANGLKMKKSGN